MLLNTATPGQLTFLANANTNVQFSTTYTPASACSPAPAYILTPIPEQFE